LRLICLPYAGGGAAVYYRWRAAMPTDFDLIPLSLPGHDGRMTEPLLTDLRDLAAYLVDELSVVLDRPFAVLGHSMGGWIVFELMRELRRRGMPLPRLAVLSASGPPDAARTGEALHRLPDEELIAAVDRRYGGIPAAVRSDPMLLRMLLPALRADLQMVETYAYADEPPLEVEILAIGGTDDPAVPASKLLEWQRHTTRNCAVRLFPGGHFFLFESERAPGGIEGLAAREQSPALRLIASRLQASLDE
jgi:medium-chain acyl-[acyl-carrier-protein] hydrolase